MQDRADRIEYISDDSEKKEIVFNLSETGVSFLRSKAEEVNSIVYVRINDMLTKAKVIYCQKRTDGFRIGLQFWNISAEQQSKLKDIVDSFSRGVPVSCSIEKIPPESIT